MGRGGGSALERPQISARARATWDFRPRRSGHSLLPNPTRHGTTAPTTADLGPTASALRSLDRREVAAMFLRFRTPCPRSALKQRPSASPHFVALRRTDSRRSAPRHRTPFVIVACALAPPWSLRPRLWTLPRASIAWAFSGVCLPPQAGGQTDARGRRLRAMGAERRHCDCGDLVKDVHSQQHVRARSL